MKESYEDILRQQRIEEFAQAVLNILGFSVPIRNMEDVVKELGGTVKIGTPSFSAEGQIFRDGNSFCITVPDWVDSNRRNVMLALCVGRLFLQLGFFSDDTLWCNRKCSSSFMALEQNEFMAGLLMPRDAFEEKVYQYVEDGPKGEWVNMKKISNYFHVPVEVAVHRGTTLGILKKGW